MALDRDAIYYARLGQTYGPIDLEALRDLLTEGKVGADDHLWDPDLEDWIPVRRYPFLFETAPAERILQEGENPSAVSTPPPPLEAIDEEEATRLSLEVDLSGRPPAPELPLAPLRLRFAAWFVDILILTIPVTVLLIVLIDRSGLHADALAGMQDLSEEDSAILQRIYDQLSWGVLVMQAFYWTLLESSRWQATLGKRMMGLVVTDTRGYRLSWQRALLRYLGRVLCGITLGVGFTLALITERRQGLHDLIARTLVMRR